VTSYEAGYKASLFDRRLRFALAGFIADYKDVQVPDRSARWSTASRPSSG
jgi:outer membrane receptor for ferric coprogen and ferric-rhodotorulic acid